MGYVYQGLHTCRYGVWGMCIRVFTHVGMGYGVCVSGSSHM